MFSDAQGLNVCTRAALALATRTDLAILQLSGSVIEDRGDHLIVRTVTNPGFHWGNFLLVTDGEQVDDAEYWLSMFVEAFPNARHRAIALVTEPSSPAGVAAWREAGLEIEHEEALSTSTLAPPRPLADGYTVRELVTDDDWAQALRLDLDGGPIHLMTDPWHRRFRQRRLQTQRSLVTAGHAAFFGAFAGSRLVAELGIVDCGQRVARYQHVFTAPEHRRRGLTSHLLGVAARWASNRGSIRWVIVADRGSDASRLYKACGFSDAELLSQAHCAEAA